MIPTYPWIRIKISTHCIKFRSDITWMSSKSKLSINGFISFYFLRFLLHSIHDFIRSKSMFSQTGVHCCHNSVEVSGMCCHQWSHNSKFYCIVWHCVLKEISLQKQGSSQLLLQEAEVVSGGSRISRRGRRPRRGGAPTPKVAMFRKISMSK